VPRSRFRVMQVLGCRTVRVLQSVGSGSRMQCAFMEMLRLICCSIQDGTDQPTAGPDPHRRIPSPGVALAKSGLAEFERLDVAAHREHERARYGASAAQLRPRVDGG